MLQLGAVVGHDHLRLAAALGQCREFASHPAARDRGVGNRRQALPGHVIDDVEDAKAATAGELVVDEIERPTGVWLGRDEDRRAGSYRLAASSAFAHGQSLFAVEPVDAVDAGWLAFVPQQDVEAAITEATPLTGKLVQTGTQFRVRRPA